MGFFRRFFGRGGNSGRTANNRIRIIIAHDRTDISPRLLEELRREMIEVLTKYMDIDTDKIEMNLDRDDQAVALVANIPVLRVKRGTVSRKDAEGQDNAAPNRTKGDRRKGR